MSAINVEVKPKEFETFEKMLKRFTKQCKKQDVIKQYCEHTAYKSKSEKKREKRLRQERLRRKEAEAEQKLLLQTSSLFMNNIRQ